MIKKLLLVLLLWVMVASAATINGIVVDQDNNPIAGKQIVLQSRIGRTMTTSDRAGGFTFEARPGNYLVMTRGDTERLVVRERQRNIVTLQVRVGPQRYESTRQLRRI